MSFQAKRELLLQVGPRYRKSGKKEKSVILDEFIISTGYKRKYAIKLLNMKTVPELGPIKRKRNSYYSDDVKEALKIAWTAANCIGSKRLAPFLSELLPHLEQHGHLSLSEPTREKLLKISAATIDRLLKTTRSDAQIRGRGTTKHGSLLKHQIPIRTFADWNEKQPGFFEADLVAHCGWSMEGCFLYTLVLTDIATTWVECLALPHRSQEAVIKSLDHARKLLPLKILGLDTDNGSEFINKGLMAYCEQNKITLTRGRRYKKNDQCFVEQKNGAVVRQIVGYDRFEGEAAYRQLAELYRAVRLYNNFFQPSMKLIKKQRSGSRVQRNYDTAQTPFQRLRCSGVLCAEEAKKLEDVHDMLDPVHLLRQITILQDSLWQHTVLPGKNNEEKTGCSEVKFHVTESESSSNRGSNETVINNSRQNIKRRYKRTQKSRKPRNWRTRKDPFEGVWPQICRKLEQKPETTGKSLLLELQKHYPGKFPDSVLRTLQRRVKTWRSQSLITFNDEWLQGEVLIEGIEPFQLKAQGY